jgi:chemotaxis protein methyltransferase CheR
MSHADTLSTRDFDRLCSLIYEESGIKMGPDKRVMLEGRLKRRLSTLHIPSYREYCDHLFTGEEADGEELVHLIDVVTTNKTDFFREKAHFDFLAAEALPALAEKIRSSRELLVWCAASSTGEEPYTLAMVLNEYGADHPGFRFKLLASDISNTVLAKARLGVYTAEVVKPVPVEWLRKYFMRSRDPEADLLRVVPELRMQVEFRRLNLMEEFGMSQLLDVIFCRNVIIYFDRPTQERLFQKMCRQLVEGGYLFIGHSESLHHMDLPLVSVAPALYRKV